MGTFFVVLITAALVGAIIGLIPFFFGRYMGKPELGQLGMIFCMLSAMIHWGLPFLVAICFVLAILLVRNDINIRRKNTYMQPSAAPPPAALSGVAGQIEVDCLSGPLKGQRYFIGAGGLMFGRDNDCHIRFPADTPGISRHHCCIRWQNGVPALTDLNSKYGTFLQDGRQLMPNNPVQLIPGSSFRLSNCGYLFQVVVR